MFLHREVPWRPRRRWAPASCNVRTWVRESVPWGIELNEDEREFLDDSWEIVSCQDQDMLLFGVSGGQEDQAK